MSAHSALVNRILMTYSVLPDLTLFKMNNGVARALHSKEVIRYGIDGCTDIIGIQKPFGRWVAIEAKTGSGELQENQERFRDMILSHGGIWVLARTEEDVGNALKGLDQQCAAL
jgi:hypothetical protein